MAEITSPAFRQLTAALRETLTAGQAIRDGIATHAEKHKAEKQAAHHKAQTDKRLQNSAVKPG
jgi:hypothetical protein